MAAGNEDRERSWEPAMERRTFLKAGVLAAAIAAYLAFAIGVGGSSVYPANRAHR